MKPTKKDMAWIEITKDEALRYCPSCNFAGRLANELKPCNYPSHPSMNYRGVSDGMCALRPEDRLRMEQDYGVLKNGKIKSKGKA